MKRFAAVCILLIVGCGPLSTAPDDVKPAPVVAKQSFWSFMADDIAEHRWSNTTQLELVVKEGRKHGLTEESAKAFYKALGGDMNSDGTMLAKERPLTDADAKAIRGL